MSLTRVRPVNPIRQALEQAMLSPRVQSAVSVFVSSLVDEGEAILRQRYAGETLRIYNRKGSDQGARDQRNRRIRAMAAPPSSMSPAAIAAAEGISVRHVRRLLVCAQEEAADIFRL